MVAPRLDSAQFTLGPNNSVAIFELRTGVEIDWGLSTIINFSSMAINERKPISLMPGAKFDLIFKQGWKGEFHIQRTNNLLDQYWSNLEDSIEVGAPWPSFNIIQTVRETDRLTTTRMTFQGAVITYDNAGTYENENGVVQVLNFTAPKRIVRTI